MSFNYNHDAFVYAFGGLPHIYDSEVNLCEFITSDQYGFSLGLYLSPYEGFSSLTLKKKELINSICDFGINGIEEIKVSKEKLVFVGKNKGKSVVSYLKPNFSIVMECDESYRANQFFAIKFDKYELMELFGSLPEFFDAGFERYTTQLINNFQFLLSFSQLNNVVKMQLNYNELQAPLFDVYLFNIVKIATEPEKLKIYRHGSEEPIIVYFKPHFSLSLDLNL